MRQPSSHPRDNTGWNGRDSTATTATETDPLLQVSTQSFTRQTESQGGSIRVRRSSRSPTVLGNQHFRDNQQQSQMNTQIGADQAYDEKPMAYKMIHDDASRSSQRYGTKTDDNFLTHKVNLRRVGGTTLASGNVRKTRPMSKQ